MAGSPDKLQDHPVAAGYDGMGPGLRPLVGVLAGVSPGHLEVNSPFVGPRFGTLLR